jgi:hypothetical protein
VNYQNLTIERFIFPPVSLGPLIGGAILILLFHFAVFAQQQTPAITASEDQTTLTIDGTPETKVFSVGKNVIVRQAAKEVLVFGGDVIIEGKVEGDVGTIGGSISQRENAFIGGDVIVFGGAYHPETPNPLRIEGKETVIIGVFEEELRNFAQNPADLFSPAITWGFIAQRVVSVLFWFIVSLAFATISPGAVSRAVARFQLSTLKIFVIGIAGFLVTTVGVIISVGFLPGYLSGVIGLMALLLLVLAYVFGRVALQVSLGKFLQKQFLPERKHSETLAILLGVIALTVILSMPFVWTFAFVLLLSASIGLVLTARARSSWQKV